ncbi:MAG TPA: DUF6134 family protein [Chitinophagaceae bacterium]|jgi:hypothetical protein
MIPVFIIWLVRRYRLNQKRNKSLPGASKTKQIFGSTGLLLFVMLTASNARSQNKSLNYQILRNGSKVGTLHFSEINSTGTDYLKMESDVKTRFIFTFKAHANEEATYVNGVLLRSSIYRELNGSEKANKQHQAGNRQYIIHEGRDLKITKNYPITYSMLSLYSKEPENIGSVYSDNFETFVAIQRTDVHKYKITLPDGNYNYYYYKNGVLNQVEVHHSLYSANIILTN